MKNSKRMPAEKRIALKNKLEKLAWLTDSSIALPGKFRIGLDSIIGLIPIVGDLITAMISLFIMVMGLRAKVPKIIVFRMSLNILWDTIIGAIPVLGDIYDMIFKSNQRNVKLLNRYMDDADATEQSTHLWLLLLVSSLLGFVMFYLWLIWQLIQWIITFF